MVMWGFESERKEAIMNCPQCGAAIADGATFCPSCGAAMPVAQQPTPYAQAPAPVPVQDKGSIGWGILGFLIPLVGLILFLVWRNKKPNSARVAGIGAIIGFVVNLVITFVSGS